MSDVLDRAKPVRRFDELRDTSGGIRPAWKPLADALAAIGPEEFARRSAVAQAMLRDNGVTYNVYDNDDGQTRAWQLDVMPFVVAPSEWNAIEAGIVQRARLTDAILRDIYGPQKLIADGHLPPHVVLGHPQFLRPLVGLTPQGGTYVHLYSADLTRSPDGSWTILASRADAASGIGYALENRIAVAKIFPDIFADMEVRRLASFFSQYRDHVQSLSQIRRGRTVLLTPGPHNEAYFEHAFLAHYLGLTLVEGDDLAAREGQVYLKTLTGLERVGVIFRRVDSDYCDALELRGDSALGVPGLIDAVRSGGVVVANALGGGVMESPAMDAHLPQLCRALLGEDLKIPDVPTVWCGTEGGAKDALARLDRAVVRDAFDARPLFSRHSTARLGSELSQPDILALKDRIMRRGATVVVQDAVPLGQAPVYADGAVGARPISLRVFAACTPGGYIVMPGGLVRMARDNQPRALSIQSGAASKDVWVLGRETADSTSLLRASTDIRRTGEVPTSRAMDNLFWLGRYSERAECSARVLRAVIARLGDDPAFVTDSIERFLVPQAQGSASALLLGDDARRRAELRSMLYQRKSPDALQSILARARQTAWSARDRLSLDTWRVVYLFTDLPDANTDGLPLAQALAFLDTLIRHAAALSGLCAENMTRNADWLFVDLGRRIERASHLMWLVRQASGEADGQEAGRIRLALEIADSSMTYRSRYFNVFDVAALIDLLLLDETNPRAVVFQLSAIERNLKELPLLTPAQRGAGAISIASDTRMAALDANAQRLAEPDESGARPLLFEFAERIEVAMTSVNSAITDAYFQHTLRHRTGSARGNA